MFGCKGKTWQEIAHMPSAAMFHERKANNFFQVNHKACNIILKHIKLNAFKIFMESLQGLLRYGNLVDMFMFVLYSVWFRQGEQGVRADVDSNT